MAPVPVRVVGKASEIDLADWNACAGSSNPFAQGEFFRALEDSGSATVRTGWQPVHLVADAADGRPAGIMPCYLKTHSQGEYVFDHAWADAWSRAGGDYYPKLQAAFPFTPATGPRLLLRDSTLAPALIAAAEQITQANNFSSAHATFITPEQQPLFRDAVCCWRSWCSRTTVCMQSCAVITAALAPIHSKTGNAHVDTSSSQAAAALANVHAHGRLLQWTLTHAGNMPLLQQQSY